MVYLIIATDSRGALLDRFLSDDQPFNYSYETNLVVIGGATIKNCQPILLNVLILC